MPSFDIVSQVNPMEIENAVNQAKIELANRFDFKNSKWEIVLEKTEIKLTADDQFKVTTLNEIIGVAADLVPSLNHQTRFAELRT